MFAPQIHTTWEGPYSAALYHLRTSPKQVWNFKTYLQGEPYGQVNPPPDLVPKVPAADCPSLYLPTTLVGWCNIPNRSQLEVVTDQMGHPVYI